MDAMSMETEHRAPATKATSLPRRKYDKKVVRKPVAGGYVSYVDLEAEDRSKVRYADLKPYFVPCSLDGWHGPTSGTIKLPQHLFWSGEGTFSLSERSSLCQCYQIVLQEGRIEDFERLLDKEALLSIWDDLYLPPRIRELWEGTVEELKCR